MRTLVLRGLAARKLRTFLTALSIILGVAMITGTFVLTDQISGAFDDIFAQANKGTDAVVLPKATFGDQTGNNAVQLTLDESLVAKVRAVPQTDRAEGELESEALLVVKGKLIKPQGGPPFIFSYLGPPFQTSKLVSGAWPQRGQIALDKAVARRADVGPGDHVGVTTDQGIADVAVSGIVEYPASTGGAIILIATLPDMQRWYREPGRVSSIVASARPGVSQTELARAVRAAVGRPGLEVKTGEQNAKDTATQVNDAIGSFLTPALLAFGVIAVFVGGFIIFNTFTITVAQRLRELALLRTLGASRGQVLRLVIAEALLLGLVASLIGIAGGFLVALGIGALFDAVGFGLPTRAAALAPRTVVIGLLVGVGVTLVASISPARRATRIPPIAALREGATLPRGRFSRLGPVFALLIAAAGILLILNGFTSSGAVSQRLLGMGVGALLVFVAVAMLGRFAVGPIARVVGVPIEAIGGAWGRLARENAMRNTRRTAVTSAALMIGLALVVFVSIFAAGIKQGIADVVHGALRGDVVVTSSSFGRLPGAVVPAVARAPGVTAAAGVYTDSVQVNGRLREGLVGVDASFPQVYKTDWVTGSDALFATLGADGALVEKGFAKTHGLAPGSRLQLETQAGRTGEVVVRGVYDGTDSVLSGVVVSRETFDGLSANRDTDVVVAKGEPGASPEATAAAVTAALRGFPLAKVQTSDAYVASTQQQLDPIIYALYALLSMSVVISLFGIVNTLVLSIFERTREIGMLRAIGTSRWQVRWMITGESVITAAIGGVLGMVVGIFFGFVITKGLEGQGVRFVIPWGELVVFLLLAVVAGMLSAIFPARRAARLDVLQALAYE